MSSSVPGFQRHSNHVVASRSGRRLALVGITTACLLLMQATAFSQSYRVFPWPVESPNHGSRALVTSPQDAVASPFGWHDTNAVAGAEYTTLRGNNAYVYLDADNNGVPDGPGPDGGAALSFDSFLDLTLAPLFYPDALSTNTFYWTNRLHDIFYRHGFTPARGNMQQNTYGLGGAGNDPVKVEVSKGGQFNNVTWAITADGTSPSIRQYVWNQTTPHRESSFDAGTTAFAYSVLMYSRLAPTCSLGVAETPYIGYADFLGILVTTNFQTATPTMARGIGTYLSGQPTNGTGFRGFPYSTDLSVFPRTYADLSSLTIPHGTGTVWGGALWDLTWAMVARYGASNNLLTGNGAENRLLRLVIEGMRTSTCPGGFVSARDSILLADFTLQGSADRCTIWKAFARRGLGFGAAEGSPFSTTDQTFSFNLPMDCWRIFTNGFDSNP